jgi:uncharacterized phage protein (TIGR01671 family)
MREIKFRAWDKIHKNMIYVLNHFLYYDGMIRAIGGENWSAPRENYVLMQATGLKDKNGKEIYEGDIVRIDDDLFEDNGAGKICAVEFGRGTFDLGAYQFVGWHCGGDHSAQDVLLNDTVFIIGNICENPRLIQEAKA